VAVAFGCVGGESPPATEAPALGEQKKELTLDRGDADFILEGIRISEQNAAGTPLQSLVGAPVLPYGMRTVSGRDNNIVPGREGFGAADRTFPRMLTPSFRGAEPFDPDGPGPAPASPTSYLQTSGLVVDSQPRTISNLVVDQTPANPAANAAAAANPAAQLVASPGLDGIFGTADDRAVYHIPNVAPDVGLSASFNAWFILFGQFFDHGLDLVDKGSSGTVFMPLQPDDPLFVPGSPTNFMVLTRATNQPGPDGVLGTADDRHEHMNRTTPFVDQNQTYTSHPSHQTFLREYVLDASGRPVSNGRMLDGARGGIGTWGEVKAQARNLLGVALRDEDALNVPLLATDAYGRFLRSPAGFAQVVTAAGLVSGTPAAPASTVEALRTGHMFLVDIAHFAVPGPGLAPDPDTVAGGTPPPGTYDNELLEAHFCTGDGRGNENIGLTSVHFIFHAEHNRLVQHVKDLVLASGDPAFIAEWLLPGASQADGIQPLEWNGERLFQAARFGTEMQYQHLVFEEFARKVQPAINPFLDYDVNIDPAIVAEFAHTVYRFGHSMLTEQIRRTNPDGTPNDIALIPAFLNPLAFSAGGVDDAQSAGAVIRGMTREVGNEVDEFVTEALRNNLVGLPLDLPAINLARGRDTGIPPLNEARRQFFTATGSSAVRPYDNWVDFGLALRHPESLANFVAAYGTHPTVLSATTLADKRAAGEALVTPGPLSPVDAADFLAGTGAWAGVETGLNEVDYWVGGLAEKQVIFGGLLGSTFNFVFERQLENLQNGDRLYYLSRNKGLHFLSELEGNSFSQVIMANVPGIGHLPFDVFSRPAFIFEMSAQNLTGPIVDDPATPAVNEAAELVRVNGFVRYTGHEHVVMGGTPGNDKMWGNDGDDTLWGDEGDDDLEGGDGNDQLIGGPGNDVITDLNGVDGIKGGPGNDAINGGPGFGEILLGQDGQDFIMLGEDDKEAFGGHGDDFVYAQSGLNVIFGNEGDDWIEGGNGADQMQGENGAPGLDSPIQGNDVLIGGGGVDDNDCEGGDDIMINDGGGDKNFGMRGYDWVTYKGIGVPADADLRRLLAIAPPDVRVTFDRFRETEGLSGWNLDDHLVGDDTTCLELLAVQPGSGLNNAINDITQINRIRGLAGILPAGATSFCAGNILLGGAGSDVIQGNGGDDIIDGDRWLNVRIAVVDAAENEIGTADGMTALLTNKSGVLAGTPATLTLAEAVFTRVIHPGMLRIVREILVAPPNPNDLDTAVFSDLAENYDVVNNPDGSITVIHARGTALDGTDTLFNIEQLLFLNPTPPPPVANLVAIPGNGQVTLTWTTPPGSLAVQVLRSTTGFAATPADAGQLLVFEGAASTFTDPGLVNGTTYFYTVFNFTVLARRGVPGNFSAPATVQATPGVASVLVVASFLPASGPAGSTVVITGSGFLGATSVTFSGTPPVVGVPAVFSVISDLSIAAIVPAGAASGPISVATAVASSSSPAVFTVTVPGPVALTQTVFSDNFDACTSSVDLGPNWVVNGRWLCVAQRARGEVAAAIATANTAALTDTGVQARVQLTGIATQSGVVARATANGSAYYAARLLSTGRLQIIRVAGGTTTVLADVAVPAPGTALHTVRLTATGSAPVALAALLDGTPAATATDASAARLLSGRAGLLSGTVARTQYDDFAVQTAAAAPPPPPPPPPPGTVVNFADNFNACTSAVDLGANWIVNGRWLCVGGRARGEVLQAIATAITAPMGDTSVQARVQLTGVATGSGVVARAAGGSYYAARVLATQRLQIVRVTPAGTTVLADVPATVPVNAFTTVRLVVSGAATVQLDASLNGVPLASATDTSAARLSAGSAGLLSGTVARTQFDDFVTGSL